MSAPDQWPLWEVFVRSRNGLSHKHFGSLHAPDAKEVLFTPSDDKVYRHPTFYQIPDEVGHM